MVDLIFDLGCNTGENLEYYLSRAKKVVAVDANQEACTIAKNNFAKNLNDGSLIVINRAVIPHDKLNDNPTVTLYKPAIDEIWSTRISSLQKEWGGKNSYVEYSVQTTSIIELIRDFGTPAYLKIDIEGSEKHVLKDLLENELRPEDISVEIHNQEAYGMLVALNYQSYQVIGFNGGKKKEYINRDGQSGSIPKSSTGFFGTDLPNQWMSFKDMSLVLAITGLGWRDLHASNRTENPNSISRFDFSSVTRKVNYKSEVKRLLRTTWTIISSKIS